MPDIQHSALTTTELHEPKGADSANADEVYLADGAGSGNWYVPVAHMGGYVSFDSATPAYAHSVTTSDTALNPTLTTTHAKEFTYTNTPNARYTYTGTVGRHSFIEFNASLSQSSGSSNNIEVVIAINGVVKEGSRTIVTTTSGEWHSVSVAWDAVLATNDYIEVFIKGGAATTVNFAHAYINIKGYVEQ